MKRLGIWALLRMTRSRNVRAALIAILLSSVPSGVFAQAVPPDYITELIKLTTLTENQQYREAINGYRALQAQPGTPGWFKAASEYEIAELYAALQNTGNAITAFMGAVQLGFDDCITPRASDRLKTILQDPKAMQAFAAMKIAEGDFHELFWLQAEVQHARHDGRMMIIENTNRLDHAATVVPQAQLPMRPTTSPGVLYWRQQLLVRQRIQREFVMKADVLRIQHAATMAAIGGVSSSIVLESARRAAAVAESRSLEIRRRAFVPVPSISDRLKSCSEWSAAQPPSPSR